MADITEFTTEELKADLVASQDDSLVCAKALSLGITEYSGGDVSWRLERNNEMMRIIIHELIRRGTDEQELGGQERL